MSDLSRTRQLEIPVGVVVRRTPGITRWRGWQWQAVGIVPGAPPAEWKELRREGEAVEFHAATVSLVLHRAEVEGYRVALSMEPPSVFVILDEDDELPQGRRVRLVTASAYEAQEYADAGEQLIEPVPMPPGLAAWIQAFVEAHARDEKFVKRKRDRVDTERKQDGIGDVRIRQDADVYRAPSALKAGKFDA